MTVRRRRSDRSGRSKLHSPGRPDSARREEFVRFWAAIATGRSSEDAARDAGVSPPVGSRWFRRSGGMPPSHLSQSAKPLSGRYLSFEEREEIALLRAQGRGIRHIACRLERAPSTISREVRRNAATRSGGLDYRATTAQWHADRSAKRPKPAKLATNEALRRYVQDRLEHRSPHRFEVGDTGLLGSLVDSPEKGGINRRNFNAPLARLDAKHPRRRERMESSTRAIGFHSRRATRRRHPWASRRVPQREIRRRRVRSRPPPPPFLFGQRRHHSMVASNWLNSGFSGGIRENFWERRRAFRRFSTDVAHSSLWADLHHQTIGSKSAFFVCSRAWTAAVPTVP